MTYLIQAPYTTITPNLAFGSDPSRGPVGNPVILRRGQTLQNLLYKSTQSRGAIIPEPVPVSLSDCQVVITVASVDYPDPNAPVAGVGDEFFEADIIQIGDYLLRAGYEFGVGEGHGVGSVNAVAASLGSVITKLKVQSISSVVVLTDQVGLFLRTPFSVTVKTRSPSGALTAFANNFTLSIAPRQVANLKGSIIQAPPFI